jgi:hypothetical protein
MVRPKLDAHYSVLGLISRVAFCLGLSLLFWFVAAHLIRQNWFAITNYMPRQRWQELHLRFYVAC